MASSVDDAKALETLFKSVREDFTFKKFCNFADRIPELEKEVGDLKIVKSVQDRELHDARDQLENTRKQLEQSSKQISDLQKTLKEKDAKIGQLQANLRTERQRIEGQLSSVTKRLDAKTRQLEKLEGLTSKLALLPRGDIKSRLEALFLRAHRLATSYFSIDLELPDIDKNAVWKIVKSHEVVKSQIPLPLVETPAAKQMRTAAFLAILSSELSAHIFQPTYILEMSGEFSEYLLDLANKQPQHGSLLRSVLAATLAEDERTLRATRRANAAVNSIFTHVGGLLADQPQKDRFKVELGEFCKQACDLWQHIQTFQEMVTTNFNLYESTDWKILEFNPPTSSDLGAKAKPNSNASPQATKKKPATPEPPPAVECAVWPRFVILDTVEETLTAGYALSEGQVKAGKAEEKAQQARGLHREARLKSRAASTAERGV